MFPKLSKMKHLILSFAGMKQPWQRRMTLEFFTYMGHPSFMKISGPSGQYPDMPDEVTGIFGNEKDIPDTQKSVNS